MEKKKKYGAGGRNRGGTFTRNDSRSLIEGKWHEERAQQEFWWNGLIENKRHSVKEKKAGKWSCETEKSLSYCGGEKGRRPNSKHDAGGRLEKNSTCWVGGVEGGSMTDPFERSPRRI